MKGEEILDLVRYYVGDAQHSRYTEINEAYREILELTDWTFSLIQDESLLSLVANTKDYNVDFSGFRGGFPRAVYLKEASDVSWTLIEEAKGNTFEELVPTSGTSTPTMYRLSGNSNYNFTITPTPSVDMGVRFDGVKAIGNLERGVTPVFHEDYHPCIALLAGAFILQSKGDEKGFFLEAKAKKQIEALGRDVNANRSADLSWDPYPFKF
jgi:hypothetical protein